ncbi:MAG TPA: PQQ-binding-like beta-propeller repeat protein [Euzebyales bacterium]|nr:PQQ-binding-like beta-propeller repeat protein [Euzebyales bacterium]
MGRTVGRHVLHARVLRDAVSDVWYARDAERPNQQAIVRLIDLDVAPIESLEACLAEARAASDVLHGNVVRVHTVGDVADPFVLCRFARITPLASELSERWTVADAISMLGPIGDALDAAADAGIPHGAVHPRSLWIEDRRAVGRPRRIVVSAFGLHHLLASVAARDRHRPPPDDFLYVAPELLRGASPTNRSDQYALAAAVHHAVSGRPPFERPTLAALFGAHLFAQPPGCQGVDRDAAEEFDAILARALAKDPDDRFERCDAFVTALERWLDATSDGSWAADRTRPADPRALPVQVLDPRRRRVPVRAAAAAVAVAGVLALGLAAAAVTRDPVPAAEPAAAVTRDPVPAAEPASSAADQVAAPAPAPRRPTFAAPAVRWQVQLDGRPTALNVAPAGLVVESRGPATVVDPATGEVRGDLPVDGDGVVAGEGQFVTVADAGLRSVDVADGSVTWEAPVTPASTPTAFDDTVYGISDADVPQLIARDAGSGEQLWAFPQDESVFPADTAVAAEDDFVYLADDSTVYGILPTGATAGVDTPLIDGTEPAPEPLCLWRHEVDDQLWAGSLVVVDGGVTVASRSGTVCLRHHVDGVPAWCVPVDGVADMQPMIHDAGDRVVVVTRAAVTALDARTGERVWRQPGPWRHTVRDADRLVAIEGGGGLAMVSLVTGTVRRPVDTAVGRDALLAVDGDIVYAARRDGTLFSLRVPSGLD